MHFGLSYIPDYDERRDGEFEAWSTRLVEEWSAADALGFDTVWLAEHLYPGYGFSPLPRLAQALAEHTRHLRIGTAVAPIGQHHPILDASHWAAVDIASGGRLDFGIGHALFSAEPDAGGRAASEARGRLEEALLMIRRLWSEPIVTHVSRYWSLHRLALRPQPLGKPTPPVYVACATSADSYVWAGANGCHLIVSPYLLDSVDAQRRHLDDYREALTLAGYDPARFAVLANYHLYLVEHERDLGNVDRDAIRYLRFLARVTSLERLHRSGADAGDETMRHLEALLRRQTIAGTPARCLDRMEALARSYGLTGWMLQVDHRGIEHAQVLEQLHLFAERVMPALAPRRRETSGALGEAAAEDLALPDPVEDDRRPE